MALREQPGEKGENVPHRSFVMGGITMTPGAVSLHPRPHSCQTDMQVGCFQLLSEYSKYFKASSLWKHYRTFQERTPALDIPIGYLNLSPNRAAQPSLFLFLFPQLQTCLLIWSSPTLPCCFPDTSLALPFLSWYLVFRRHKRMWVVLIVVWESRQWEEAQRLANSLPGGQSKYYPEG